MKPLLPLPLTYLDRYISDRLVWRKRGLVEWDADRLQSVSVFADRRDAELMRQAQRSRRFGEIGYLPTLAALPHDPYPYVGGIKLGRRAEWEAEQTDPFNET